MVEWRTLALLACLHWAYIGGFGDGWEDHELDDRSVRSRALFWEDML